MDQSERALLDDIDHPVFALEPGEDGLPRYAAFNRFAQGLLGKPEDEVLGRTAVELYGGRLGQIAFDHHSGVLFDGARRTYELSLPLKDGRRRVRTTLQPSLDAEGRVRRIIGSSTDISDRRAMDEMRAGVETMSKELGEFVSSAALDLRRPLKKARAVADMLRDGFEDLGDGKLELIGVLERLSTDTMALVTDLLSHVEAVSAISDVTVFDFADLGREIMALLDPLDACVCEIEGGKVLGDRTAAMIAIRNLIDGALNRARAGDGPARNEKLRFRLSVEDHLDDGYFAVTLRDNGPGLDSSTLFFLNGGALRSDAGFGLMGVRRLILARGGRLTAINEAPPGGATIRFTLPGEVVGENEEAGEPSVLPAQPNRASGPRSTRLRV